MDPLVARSARAFVSGVWVYEGLWRKVLGHAPQEAAIVEAIPGLDRRSARVAIVALGIGETALAGWVASGRRPRACALVQTSLVICMNAGGLVVGRRHIPDPAGLVARNTVFLSLVWLGSAPG